MVLTEHSIESKVFDFPVTIDDVNEIDTKEKLQHFLYLFENLNVCHGGESLTRCPNFQNLNYKTDTSLQVWRHSKCPYIIPSGKLCSLCKRNRRAVYDFGRHPVRNKINNLRVKVKKCQTYKSRLRIRNKQILTELKNVKEKMRSIDQDSLFLKIESINNISQTQKMLIKECYRMSKYEKKTSRRYTSEWLLTCLLLHIRSPATYKFIRNNDIMPLPNVSTIRRYLSRVKVNCGLDDEFFQAFERKLKTENTFEKQGILIFDEMSVRQSIELNVKNMKLAGIQDFGAQHNLTSRTVERRADHALVFMFSSLAGNFNQTVAVYGAKGATGGTCLAQLIMQVIRKLEKIGALVHGVVCDGATTNKKMWKEFCISGKLNETNNKIIHPIDENRFLYFFSDAPHLIKCVRNRVLQKPFLKVKQTFRNFGMYLIF